MVYKDIYIYTDVPSFLSGGTVFHFIPLDLELGRCDVSIGHLRHPQPQKSSVKL